MRKQVLERREQVRLNNKRKRKSPQKIESDSEDEEPEEAVVTKPLQKKRKIPESAQKPSAKRAKTQVSLGVESSNSEINVEAVNRHVH